MNHNQLIGAQIVKTINKAIRESDGYQQSLAIISGTDAKDYKFDFEKAKKRAIEEFLKELTSNLNDKKKK